jgi:hypothetical protein
MRCWVFLLKGFRDTKQIVWAIFGSAHALEKSALGFTDTSIHR